jgi:hypothetical protein
VGLAVTNHTDTALATALFDNVALTGPAPPAPPGAPSNLVATGGVNQATLTWTDATNELVVKIERKLTADPDTSYVQINTVAANVINYTDASLAPGNYTYRVRAYAGGVNSAYSNTSPAVVSPPTPPATPSGLDATGGVGQATLVWTDTSNNEDGFKIERKLFTEADTAFMQINTVAANVTNYTDPQLPPETYTYRVRSFNSAGNSPSYSNTDNAVVTAPSGPNPPTNLSATSTGTTVNLTWVDSSSNETGFLIERKLDGGAFSTLITKPAGSQSHGDATVVLPTNPVSDPTNTYVYRVIATGTPNSAPSNEAVVILGNPAADAYVRSGTSAGTNFGTAAVIDVKHTNTTTTKRNGFLRFSLSGVQTTVTSARLRLFGNAATTAKATNVHSVADITWGEAAITWNYPTTDAGGPAVGAVLSTQTVQPTTQAFYEWDVTAYIQAQKTAGASAVTLGVKSNVLSDEGQTTFNSKEGTTAANRPVLIISSK